MTPSSMRCRSLPVLLLLLACAPAAALKSDREKPMDVNADRSEFGLGEGQSVLSGSVRITQGTTEVAADRAVIHQTKAGDITRAVLDGKPAMLAQDLDDGGRLDARALNIDYDIKSERVIFSGDVVITQPRGEMRAGRITYDLTTGKLSGDGGEAGGGRVQLHILPQQPAPAKTD